MTTINANMSNSIDWIPLSASDAATIAPGTYILDSEYIVVGGPHLVRPAQPSSPLNGRWCSRAQAGSTAATHSSGATLTRYYPDAPGGDVVNPLTEDLDADGNSITNVSDIDGEADTPITITAAPGGSATGAFVELLQGNAQSLGDGGEASLTAGHGSTGPGGDASVNAGAGGAGQNGGAVTLSGGTADAGDGAFGGSIQATNGSSGGDGGGIVLGAADALASSDGDGGGIFVQAGAGDGAGAAGDITVILQGGNIVVTGLPSSDPEIAGALYSAGAPGAGDPKALMVSGGPAA